MTNAKPLTYADHLALTIGEALRAVPEMSARGLSRRAGLNPSWVADFLASGSGTLTKAEQVVAAIRDLCPQGETGDRLRLLLQVLDGPDLGEVAA